MHTLQIRDVPDEVLEELERVAARLGRSLNDVVVDVLERAGDGARPDDTSRAFVDGTANESPPANASPGA